MVVSTSGAAVAATVAATVAVAAVVRASRGHLVPERRRQRRRRATDLPHIRRVWMTKLESVGNNDEKEETVKEKSSIKGKYANGSKTKAEKKNHRKGSCP